jgi:demethylmenaquinone methyltransferase / 2-methoxy-6-polyprenyl-1,4-benzoquinol methylase
LKEPRARSRCAAAEKYAPPAAQSSCALVEPFRGGDLSAMPDTLEERRADAAAEGGDEKREYVRATFEQIAPRYDLLNHLLSFNVDRRWRRRALRALDWTRAPTGDYLDLCAGTLDVAAQLAAERGFAGFIVGADFALAMLRAGAGKAPRGTVAAVAADAQRLPLPDACMDGAIVAFGIRNVASLDAALHETHRVLRPGARLVILEFTTPHWAPVRWGYHLYFHHVLPLIGGMISGHRSAYRYLPRSVAHFPAEPELAARMTTAGFENVRWESLTLGIAAVHVGTKGDARC